MNLLASIQREKTIGSVRFALGEAGSRWFGSALFSSAALVRLPNLPQFSSTGECGGAFCEVYNGVH
eukprot:1687209-Pyramimonas_sp.AAC.1